MKRVVCSILILVLVLSLFVPTSYAAKWDYSEIPAQVEITNNEIERLVEEAIEEVDKIDLNHNNAVKKINNIIEKLVRDTDRIAEKMIEKKPCRSGKVFSWSIWDSNPRPFECHSNALPTALMPRNEIEYIKAQANLQEVFLSIILFSVDLFTQYRI